MNIDSVQVNQIFVEIEHHFDFPTAGIGAVDFKRIEISFRFKDDQAKLIQFGKELEVYPMSRTILNFRG